MHDVGPVETQGLWFFPFPTVTEYSMMAEPPFDTGADHEAATAVFTAVTTRAVGGPGFFGLVTAPAETGVAITTSATRAAPITPSTRFRRMDRLRRVGPLR